MLPVQEKRNALLTITHPNKADVCTNVIEKLL